jgi:phage-related holin
LYPEILRKKEFILPYWHWNLNPGVKLVNNCYASLAAHMCEEVVHSECSTRTTVSEFFIRRNFVKTLEEIYYCVVTLPEKCTKLRETFEMLRDKIWDIAAVWALTESH